jgi:hypothetical protein
MWMESERSSAITRADGPRAVFRRRGVIAGAAALLAGVFSSRIGGAVEAETPAQTIRLMYDMQSPDVWCEDFGTGQVTSGKAEIAIAKDFASAVDLANYHVFVTPHDPVTKGLAVTARQADKFVVQEIAGGTGTLTFSWRLVARPKGQKAARMPDYQVPSFPIPDPATFPTPPQPPLPARK